MSDGCTNSSIFWANGFAPLKTCSVAAGNPCTRPATRRTTRFTDASWYASFCSKLPRPQHRRKPYRQERRDVPSGLYGLSAHQKRSSARPVRAWAPLQIAFAVSWGFADRRGAGIYFHCTPHRTRSGPSPSAPSRAPPFCAAPLHTTHVPNHTGPAPCRPLRPTPLHTTPHPAGLASDRISILRKRPRIGECGVFLFSIH